MKEPLYKQLEKISINPSDIQTDIPSSQYRFGSGMLSYREISRRVEEIEDIVQREMIHGLTEVFYIKRSY